MDLLETELIWANFQQNLLESHCLGRALQVSSPALLHSSEDGLLWYACFTTA